ncbi:MAG TPA: glycosyl hydrolase [Longimicrobiaceae bacterium]|nr:glycosyl hydrolase [Longimicrobiaceae bacterium]
MKHSRCSRATALAYLLPMITLIAAACQDGPTGTSDAADEIGQTTAAPAPDRPFFGGVYLGDAVSTPERIQGAIRDFATLTGKQPALVKTFSDLTCDFSASGWCGQVLRQVAATGSTNYVALDLRWAGGPRTGLLDPINAGRADAEIARVARQISSVGSLVLLEPAWEMNGNWNYAWQGVTNGGDAGAPDRYRQAWRRVVEIFRREGAVNVRWVFNPNVGNPVTQRATGPSHWNWYGHYYPGDSYVDYVGAHGFNAPRLWGGSWQNPAVMFDGPEADHILSDLARRYPGKPIIIGEFASDEGTGEAKARWIREAYTHLRSRPNVIGAVWFHMNKETDWRVDSSPAALQAYRDAMRDGGIQTAFRDMRAPSATRLAD